MCSKVVWPCSCNSVQMAWTSRAATAESSSAPRAIFDRRRMTVRSTAVIQFGMLRSSVRRGVLVLSILRARAVSSSQNVV